MRWRGGRLLREGGGGGRRVGVTWTREQPLISKDIRRQGSPKERLGCLLDDLWTFHYRGFPIAPSNVNHFVRILREGSSE